MWRTIWEREKYWWPNDDPPIVWLWVFFYFLYCPSNTMQYTHVRLWFSMVNATKLLHCSLLEDLWFVLSALWHLKVPYCVFSSELLISIRCLKYRKWFLSSFILSSSSRELYQDLEVFVTVIKVHWHQENICSDWLASSNELNANLRQALGFALVTVKAMLKQMSMWASCHGIHGIPSGSFQCIFLWHLQLL